SALRQTSHSGGTFGVHRGAAGRYAEKVCHLHLGAARLAFPRSEQRLVLDGWKDIATYLGRDVRPHAATLEVCYSRRFRFLAHLLKSTAFALKSRISSRARYNNDQP